MKTGEGFVEINGGKGEIVRLLTIDGKNLRNITIQNASQRINLDKGLYILCIKDEAIKINVR